MNGSVAGQTGMDLVEASGEAPRVAVERPSGQPGVSGPPVPGDDPVVQREPQHRQALVVHRDRWQTLEGMPEVVAQEAHQAAGEPRGVGGHDDRPVEPGHEPAGDGERVVPGGGRFEHGNGVRGQVGPAGVPAWPRALQKGQAGQVAEGFRHIDRAHRGETVGQPPKPQGRLVAGCGDHGPMIRPRAGTEPPVGRRAASIA